MYTFEPTSMVTAVKLGKKISLEMTTGCLFVRNITHV